jgi:hypothetical protein
LQWYAGCADIAPTFGCCDKTACIVKTFAGAADGKAKLVRSVGLAVQVAIAVMDFV